jgi:hypothetical protein
VVLAVLAAVRAGTQNRTILEALGFLAKGTMAQAYFLVLPRVAAVARALLDRSVLGALVRPLAFLVHL